jgi:hypothetical protein
MSGTSAPVSSNLKCGTLASLTDLAVAAARDRARLERLERRFRAVVARAFDRVRRDELEFVVFGFGFA